MSATPATANKPRPSVLSLFDPLNSPARILPSTPERKENITCSPKTSTKTGGHLNLGSETVFFKRAYSRRNCADGETKSKDGVLVDFEDGDGTGESDDEDEPTQQRQPLVELTTNQPRIQNDSSIEQLDCNELVPSVIEGQTNINGPSSLDTNPGNTLLPETPTKGQLSMPSSCESSPCDSMYGSPTIKLPLAKPETVTSGRSIPTPSIDDSNSSSTHITDDSVPASSGLSRLRDQIHLNGRDSSHEQESGTSVKTLETLGSDNVVEQEAHQPAPIPVGEVEVFPQSSHEASVPPRLLRFEAKPTPDSPPMLTDRPIPVLGKGGNAHVIQSDRRKQDRSIDLHTSIYLTGSDVEASVDLLNDEMSFLANLSDRSVDAAGNMSVMAGFGRKGCKNVFNSTGLDEGARALAIAAPVVVPNVMEVVADQRTPALELEELVPHHARRIDEQPKSKPHEVRLPPSPSPHEVALPPSPPPMRESRSRRRENDTIHPNSRLRPTEVCLPPSPPPTYVSVHTQEQDRVVLRENSRSQTRTQPHQIQLPPSPTPVFTEMPKQASKLPAAGARRTSRVFTAPQNPQPAAPVFTKATTGKEASTTTGMMKPRRSSIAMPSKVVPALAPVRPLVVKKNKPIVQVAEVEKGSTAAAPLVRTRSRPSLLSTTVPSATSIATTTTTQSTGSAISTQTTRQGMSARERLRAGYSRHTQFAPPVSNAGLASSTSSNDSSGATTTKRLGPSGSDLVRSGVQRPPKGALLPGNIVVGGGLAPHTSSSNGGTRNNAVPTRVSTTTPSTMPTTTTSASTRLPKPASRVVGSGLPTSRLPAPSASGLKRIAKQ